MIPNLSFLRLRTLPLHGNHFQPLPVYLYLFEIEMPGRH